MVKYTPIAKPVIYRPMQSESKCSDKPIIIQPKTKGMVV